MGNHTSVSVLLKKIQIDKPVCILDVAEELGVDGAVRLSEAGCDSGQEFTQIQVEEAGVRVAGVFDSEHTTIEWTSKQLQVDRLVEVKAEADGWQAESVGGGRGLREGDERVEAEGMLISLVDEGAEARLVSVVGQEAGG